MSSSQAASNRYKTPDTMNELFTSKALLNFYKIWRRNKREPTEANDAPSISTRLPREIDDDDLYRLIFSNHGQVQGW